MEYFPPWKFRFKWKPFDCIISDIMRQIWKSWWGRKNNQTTPTNENWKLERRDAFVNYTKMIIGVCVNHVFHENKKKMMIADSKQKCNQKKNLITSPKIVWRRSFLSLLTCWRKRKPFPTIFRVFGPSCCCITLHGSEPRRLEQDRTFFFSFAYKRRRRRRQWHSAEFRCDIDEYWFYYFTYLELLYLCKNFKSQGWFTCI